MRRLLALVLIGLIAAGVLALASGQVGYVTTSGVSMEPTYSAGDLVVVVPDDGYEVGDAVAYTDPGTGGTVLHRIVEGDGVAGFRLQGDNNQSIDPHEPTADELTGTAVAHVPRVGGILGSPVTKGTLALAMAGLVGSLALPRKKRTMTAGAAARKIKGRHVRPRSRVRTVWLVAIVLDVVLVTGVAAAFSLRPADAEQPTDGATLEQHLELGYTADVAQTETYPDGRIETGDTVFRNLTDGVEVFARTAGPDDVAVDGFVQLDLTVTSSGGWSRTAPLVERTALDGDLDVTANIPFAHIDRLAERIAFETGVGTGALDLAVTLTGEARVGDGEIADLEATLPLRLSTQTLTLAGLETADTEAGPAVTTTVELAPPAVDTGDADAPMDLIRPAIVALLVALGITTVIWPTNDDRSDDNDDVVRVRSLERDPPAAATSIEIADPDDLERIARQAGVPILRRDHGWEGLVSDGILYWSAPATVSHITDARHAVAGGLPDLPR